MRKWTDVPMILNYAILALKTGCPIPSLGVLYAHLNCLNVPPGVLRTIGGVVCARNTKTQSIPSLC